MNKTIRIFYPNGERAFFRVGEKTMGGRPVTKIEVNEFKIRIVGTNGVIKEFYGLPYEVGVE